MKRLTQKFGLYAASTLAFVAVLFLNIEKNDQGEWTVGTKVSYAQGGGESGERTERTYAYALIAPNQSSIDMRFNGGQRVSGTATNDGLFGVTLNWKRHIVSDQTIFSGILLPTQGTSMVDGILAVEPFYYKYSASTASSVSLISFVYHTKY